nr:ADP-ribosylation/crystallin J1 [Luteimonas panaciterrae]
MDDTVTMYRPTGPEELELVRQSGFRRWPPRLPEQPIFYPVTNEQYAIEIASRWNVKDSGVGYVTRFRVRKTFMDRHEIHKVGGAHHTEWWVPAEELEALNENIVDLIEVIGEYRGDS